MTRLDDALDAPIPAGLEDVGGAWDLRVLAALDDMRRRTGGTDLALATLDRSRSWALLSWAEGAASLITRVPDQELLVTAVFALLLFGRTRMDGRDALVVATLLWRGAERAGLDYPAAARDAAAWSGTDVDFAAAVANPSPDLPRTHVEEPWDGAVKFVRLPSAFDARELERRLQDKSGTTTP